jgi:hypothetical protein
MFPSYDNNNFDNCHIDDNILENTHLGGLNAMTICIGALCDDGESAVLIADRMVTDTGLGNLKRENHQSKITHFSKHCYVMNSGDLVHANGVINKALIDTSNIDDHYKIANAYKTFALDLATESILQTRGFHTYQSFVDKKNEMNDAIIKQLDKEIREYKLKTYIMTLFFDLSKLKYQIGLLEDDRIYKNQTNNGLCSIGIGFHIVEFLIIKSGFDIKWSLQQTKDLLIAIKSEIEPYFDGIGKTHDIVCLNKGKVIESTLV